MQSIHKIDVHGQSSRGAAHEVNHDHFAIASLSRAVRVHQTNLSGDDDDVRRSPQGHVFLVADGISGGPTPGRASRTAVDSVERYFLDDMPWDQLAEGDAEHVTRALADAFWNSQADLQGAGAENESGMGTTLTLAFVSWPDLYVAHASDSRGYLLRRSALRQLTTDHTLAEVRREVPGGVVTESSERTLWNAVGGRDERLDAEVLHETLLPGDVLALVTDGVHEHRAPAGLGDILKTKAPAEELCNRLVGRSVSEDSDDRTAVVARFLPFETEVAPRQEPDPTPGLSTAVRGPRKRPQDDGHPKCPRPLRPGQAAWPPRRREPLVVGMD